MMPCLNKKQLLAAIFAGATAYLWMRTTTSPAPATSHPAAQNHCPDAGATATTAAADFGTASTTTTAATTAATTTTMTLADQPTCHQSIVPATTTTTHHVLILGGGFAGLAAARQLLLQSNSDKRIKWHITLLEGRDRLGGRVHTVSSSNNNTPIDLGGMYFHGMWPHHNHHHHHDGQEGKGMIDLDATGGTSAHPAQGKAVWWIQRQQHGRGDDHDKNDDFVWSHMTDLERQQGLALLEEWVAYAKKKSKSNSNNNNNDSNNYSYNTDTPTIIQWWNQTHAEFCQNLSVAQQSMLDFYLQMHFDLDWGIPFYQHTPTGLDTNWDWRDLVESGDDYIASHGMETLVDHIVSSFGDEVSIHLNQKVERIERYDICKDSAEKKKKWGCRVTTTSSMMESSTTDKEQDHCHWLADVCIVTLPIGVLKQTHAAGDRLFVPSLSKAKQLALERAGIGTLNTIVVQWKRPICALNTTAHYMIPFQQQEHHRQQIDTGTKNPLRYGFVCPGILRKQYMDRSITQFYISETNLPFDNETYWKEQACQVVRTVVPTITMQDVKQVDVSAWHMDPFSLGSYSAPTTWTRGNEDRRELAKPEHDVWFFAGEHTHDTGRYQSMDGAYETGIRAAKQAQDYMYFLLGQDV